MSLSLRQNGFDYSGFLEANVIYSIDTLVGAFSFVATADKDNLIPFKIGDRIEVLADGIKCLTGIVEQVRINNSVDGHNLVISGRSLLADLLDSTLTTKLAFSGNISLRDVARNVLDSIGLSDIDIINLAGDIKQFNSSELTAAAVGTNAFEFLENYARKRQVLLTSDPDGNLNFVRTGQSSYSQPIRNVIDDPENNNIKVSSLNIDTTQRFYKYVVHSQLNPLNQNSSTNPANITSQRGEAFDTEIRQTRQLEVNAEESSDSSTATERAGWEANIRRARSYSYSAVVQGHLNGSELWLVNKLLTVNDDFCGISADLLVNNVELNYTSSGGSETKLTMTYKDAYSIQAELDQLTASRQDYSEGY